MTVKGGTSQACAACKYQRRRCNPDCALAPFFPADKPKMFQNAHRLFGVCNIMKILKLLREDQKEEAMKSIIYESDMRERFPVHGCSLVIWQLREQLRQHEEELYYVNTWLANLRSKEHCQGQIPDLTHQYSSSSEFQLGLAPNNNNSQKNCYMNNPCHHYQSNIDMPPLVSNQIFMSEKEVYAESSDNMVKPLWMQQQSNNYYGSTLSNNSSLGMKSHFMIPQGLPLQQEIEVSHDYDDMPFDTIADDRQSYIESKEACESSAESPFKDTLQSMDAASQNHELKCAAACFSLTSVN